MCSTEVVWPKYQTSEFFKSIKNEVGDYMDSRLAEVDSWAKLYFRWRNSMSSTS